VIFQGNWATALGNTVTAVADSSRWNHWRDFGGGQLLSVVAGGPPGYANALRVQQRGPNYSADVQKDNLATSPSTDYYVRFYMKSNDTSPTGDHDVVCELYNYHHLTYIRKSSQANANWTNTTILGGNATDGHGGVYPIINWFPNYTFLANTWYRFEWFIHYTNSTHIQVTPRVYDASGTLILTASDFRQEDYGNPGATYLGSATWTLASYYAAGYDFQIDPTYTNSISFGNNGQAGATDTGLYWYYGAVQVRTDTWPGP
jgi:hypothetical protein